MDILNLKTTAIETMETEDALRFIGVLLDKFPKAWRVYTNSYITYTPKSEEKMLKIELIIQVFHSNSADSEQTRYKLILYRAKNYSCCNGINTVELKEEAFNDELKFHNRFNNLM